MKITRIISASVIAGAVLLSGTACGATSTPENTVASSNQPSTAQESIRILETVNGYYSFIADPDSHEKVKTTGSDLTGEVATDDQLQALVPKFPEGFRYFDTSSSQSIQNAYKAMMLGTESLSMGGGPVEMTVPAESVTVTGNNATVNTTWLKVTENGNTHPTSPEANPDKSDLINLVKKDNGSWVIVAKDSSTKVSAP